MKTPGNRIQTWIAARPLSAVAVLVVAVLVAAGLAAQTSLSNEWIRFPDETIQETAAHNCFNPADPDDVMIRVGGICIDKYEASVWSSPTGGTQYGLDVDNDGTIDPGTEYPCSENGQDCDNIYARSVEGEQPSAFITWFQAQQALANSRKRLPTNAEWQMAVRRTPDSTDCNVSDGSVSNTGVFDNCVSDWGAFDMVGNLYEWVADWVPGGATDLCSSLYGDDKTSMCNSGNATTFGPRALLRGGLFNDGTDAGPFAVNGSRPSFADSIIGFRGAR